MFSRLRSAGAAAAHAVRALRREIGVSEVLVLSGLWMLWKGLALVYLPAAWIVCGAVIVWYGLPTRPPFVSGGGLPASRKE